MMKIFDYCFYHLIRVNTDEVNPPVLAYISGILAAAAPLFFSLITLSIWLPILPQDISYDVVWDYYYFIAIIILGIFSIRYGPKRYKKLEEKWKDKAKTTKSKLLVITYQFTPIIIAFVSLWYRWN